MTEETKRLFDAPWTIHAVIPNYVENNSGFVVADAQELVDAKVITYLPELYDALIEAAKEYCPNLKHDLNHCDNCGGEDCKAEKWVELLRKVRDGE